MNLLKLALVLGLGLLASCIKVPEDDMVLASAEEVESALARAWGEADPLTMTPNDFIFQETEQKIDSSTAPFFVLQEGVTISKMTETPTEYIYTYLYQTKVFKQNQESPASTREDHRTVSKAPAVQDMALQTVKSLNQSIKPMGDDYHLVLGFERLYGLAYSCVKTESLDKYCRTELGADSCDIQCANLKETESIEAVPDAMKAQANCGGVPTCTLQKKKVNFDWIFTAKKGSLEEKQIVNYSVTLSPDLPFLSRMTEYCFRQLFAIDNTSGQKVLVTSCTNLKNYKPAASSLP